jgi:hypothetical protein
LILLCLLSISSSNILKRRKNSSRWFLDSLFQWLKASFEVSEAGNSTPASFDAELNANERGLYLSNWSSFPKQNELLNEISYPAVVDKRNTVVFDF